LILFLIGKVFTEIFALLLHAYSARSFRLRFDFYQRTWLAYTPKKFNWPMPGLSVFQMDKSARCAFYKEFFTKIPLSIISLTAIKSMLYRHKRLKLSITQSLKLKLLLCRGEKLKNYLLCGTRSNEFVFYYLSIC